MDFSAFGPILVAQDLVEDGFGTLSRAWERDAEGAIRPVFLRRFAPALCTPQVTAALERGQAWLDLPAACGTGHRFGLEPAPHWTLDHQKSRSIRRVQEQCREEGFPLDAALSLHVAWVLANVCARFWRLGLSVGPLSLDSIRIDFEGSLFLPDLGWMPTVIRLADGDPALRAALPGLPRGPVDGELGDEALRFGTFLYELITFETLPPRLAPAQAIARAQAWTPEGPRSLPEPVRHGLERLLGSGMPFQSLDGALKEFEELVFEDEEGPSTFNLAHLMHILFRQDHEDQRQRLEVERAALARNELWGDGRPEGPQIPVAKPPRTAAGGLVLKAMVAAACLGLGGFLLFRGRREPAPPPAQVQVQAAQPQADPAPPRPAEPKPAPAVKVPVAETPQPEPPKARPMVPVKVPAGTPDRPAQVLALNHFAWPQGEPRVPVVLRVFVHEDGHALRATAVPGPAGPKVVQAATEAALRSRFLPAVQGGSAVRDWVEVRFLP